MYAELNENDELVNGEPLQIFRKPKAITLSDGTQVPRNWMQAWSEAEKNAAHIFVLATTPYDQTQLRGTGEMTYTFDGIVVTETEATQPVTVDTYKADAYRQIDALLQTKIIEAQTTPTIGIDYTDDDARRERANRKRDNKAKKKGNNPISDADDHLFDHIDQLYDTADLLYDAVEAAQTNAEVDDAMANAVVWPTWTPI